MTGADIIFFFGANRDFFFLRIMACLFLCRMYPRQNSPAVGVLLLLPAKGGGMGMSRTWRWDSGCLGFNRAHSFIPMRVQAGLLNSRSIDAASDVHDPAS